MVAAALDSCTVHGDFAWFFAGADVSSPDCSAAATRAALKSGIGCNAKSLTATGSNGGSGPGVEGWPQQISSEIHTPSELTGSDYNLFSKYTGTQWELSGQSCCADLPANAPPAHSVSFGLFGPRGVMCFT